MVPSSRRNISTCWASRSCAEDFCRIGRRKSAAGGGDQPDVRADLLAKRGCARQTPEVKQLARSPDEQGLDYRRRRDRGRTDRIARGLQCSANIFELVSADGEGSGDIFA